MALLRSTRLFVLIAMLAIGLATMLPFMATASTVMGQLPAMACKTCSHPDMAATGCPDVRTSLIVDRSATCQYFPKVEAIRFAAMITLLPHEWRTEPPVPPG